MGAGIAGLSSAIGLTKAGHTVTVLERAVALREIGAALSLWPSALAALDYLGLGEPVRAVSVEAPSSSIRSPNGAPIVRFDRQATHRALGGLPVVVLRAGLHSVLRDECSRLGVNVELNRKVETAWPDGHQVAMRCSAGEAIFDAVIGADGINSAVRCSVAADETLRDCERTAWRALVSNDESFISQTWLSVGVGRQFIVSPAPDGLAYWAADTAGSDAEKALDTDPKEILRQSFARWHEPIPQIIEKTQPDDLIVHRVFDRRPPRQLQNGPILLVGDAAHPMTPDLGQGACQALEDAAVLLHCARLDPSAEPRALFASFERVRLPRIRQIVRDSHRIGRLATTHSPLLARTRDLVTRLVPEAANNRRLGTYASAGAFERQLRGRADDAR